MMTLSDARPCQTRQRFYSGEGIDQFQKL